MTRRALQQEASKHDSVGAWAKRLYFASRGVMDTVLRPYGLGSTQWYVLYQLANAGPTMQRDLVNLLNIERATLSGVVTTLVRKGLVAQVAFEGADPAEIEIARRVLQAATTRLNQHDWEGESA